MQRDQQAKKRGTTADLATLDGFLKATGHSPGVGIHELRDGACLRVQTANTTYRIWVADPRRRTVVIRGGRFFPVATRALLAGSTVGGSLLKQSWIGLEMRMVLHCDATAVVTSPVQSVVVESASFRPTCQDEPPVLTIH